MKLFGRLIKDTQLIKEVFVEKDDTQGSFRDVLEECLIALCKELDISVPLWLKKNTTEFVTYHVTSFSKEQFVERINFDKFEIRIQL